MAKKTTKRTAKKATAAEARTLGLPIGLSFGKPRIEKVCDPGQTPGVIRVIFEAKYGKKK